MWWHTERHQRYVSGVRVDGKRRQSNAFEWKYYYCCFCCSDMTTRQQEFNTHTDTHGTKGQGTGVREKERLSVVVVAFVQFSFERKTKT